MAGRWISEWIFIMTPSRTWISISKASPFFFSFFATFYGLSTVMTGIYSILFDHSACFRRLEWTKFTHWILLHFFSRRRPVSLEVPHVSASQFLFLFFQWKSKERWDKGNWRESKKQYARWQSSCSLPTHISQAHCLKNLLLFYLSLQIFVLVSAGHAIYFQTCYSKAAKVLAKCQPWIASQSSSEFKVACMGSTSFSGFSYNSYNTYDSIGEQWLEEGGSCVSFCQVWILDFGPGVEKKVNGKKQNKKLRWHERLAEKGRGHVE